MDISNQALREEVIRPTLIYIGKHSLAAENLLVSVINRFSQQQGKHQKGFGPYQIDATTHQLVWDKYLAFRPDMASCIRGLASQRAFLANPHSELSTNLCYATAIAFVVFILHPAELQNHAA